MEKHHSPHQILSLFQEEENFRPCQLSKAQGELGNPLDKAGKEHRCLEIEEEGNDVVLCKTEHEGPEDPIPNRIEERVSYLDIFDRTQELFHISYYP